jgi:uncharacterized protein (TIGR02265 family)
MRLSAGAAFLGGAKEAVMPREKQVFATTVEALFVRGLGVRLSPEARARLLEAGLDLEHPLAISYPLEQWKTFVRIASEALYPDLPPSEAHGWMGEHFLEGYLQTFVGRVVAGLAPAFGLGLTLARICQDLRGGNNFSELRLVDHSPQHVELWMNDVLCDHPSFMVGLILRAQQVAGARDVHVEVLSFDATGCTFDIRWTEAVPQVATA